MAPDRRSFFNIPLKTTDRVIGTASSHRQAIGYGDAVPFAEVNLELLRDCVASIALPTAVRYLARHKGCSSLLASNLV